MRRVLCVLLLISSASASTARAAGVLVAPTVGLVTSESGGTAEFTIVLTTPPTSEVTISLSSSDLSEGDVAFPAVTFNPADWFIPQVVTVIGADDFIADNAIPYAVLTGSAISSDPAYADLDVVDVPVTNTDDDFPGFNVSPNAGLTTSENLDFAVFSVSLTSQPQDVVVIGLTSSDLTEGEVSQFDLYFDPSNWDIPQQVVVTGVDDGDADCGVQYAVVLYPAASLDPVYDGRDPCDVSVMNLDNEIALAAPPVVESGTLLALESVHPNPAPGNSMNVTFTLATAASARLELVDVHGRRVMTRELDTPGPGRHTVSLGSWVPPGVYWVHLVQGGERRSTRVSLLR